MVGLPHQESIIDELAKAVLKVTGYEIHSHTVCHQVARSSGVTVIWLPKAMFASFIDQRQFTYFSKRIRKTTCNHNEPEPQMMAKAIAAYQHNNSIRCDQDIPELDNMTFPSLTMVGSRPCFYKVTVTKQLSDAVVQGSYPSQVTIIKCCVPPSYPIAKVGMEDVD